VWISGRAQSTNSSVTAGAWQPTFQIFEGTCSTDLLAKLNPTGPRAMKRTWQSVWPWVGFKAERQAWHGHLWLARRRRKDDG